MATRKRRVIEDDEEDDNPNEYDGEGQPDTQVEEKEQKVAAISMVDRLKRRAAKTAELAQQKVKRKKVMAEDNCSNRSPSKSPNASLRAKKEQSIPKKPKKAQTIPKKSIEVKNGTMNEEDRIKKEKPSLLSEMKKPPIPKANKVTQNSSKNKTRPFHSSWGTTHGSSMVPKQTVGSPSRLSPSNAASTPPPFSTNVVDLSGPPDATVSGLKVEVKVEEGSDDKFGSGLRQMVLDGLKDLCKDSFEIPPERNGVDLFASFLRHKDLKPTIQTSGINIDSSNSNNLRYDFFDVDETTGAAVLQPKIPIFPEDFPVAGIREWPLSWWGIVDPSIEKKNHEDKTEPSIDADAETKSKSRRDRSSARSDSGKEGNGDRNKRDASLNTRKRSSRETYEDEHAYNDGYPSWEDRRDRFPGGEYDDGGDGYPPQLHGDDYDYNHNGPPPNGYHPNYRNPHYHGGGGGQPFPHRSRDEPPPHSRPYPRDGPPARDFRGGGRPYPAHGNSGPPPWEYSHRDSYGPQGRGPPVPRDDRRDQRDRSQRPPHSKTEREDGRHSVRKPSSSSSSRKDRIRSSK